jgi:hypothetical protein
VGARRPDDEDSTGEAVVVWDLPGAPAIDELVQLLNLSAAAEHQLEAWAKTPIGESFAGTASWSPAATTPT